MGVPMKRGLPQLLVAFVAGTLTVAAIRASEDVQLLNDLQVNPIAKTVQLLTDLQNKVIREGEVLQTQYEKFSRWCRKSSRGLRQELSANAGKKETLVATIVKCKADLDNLQADVGKLTGLISTDEADLKAAKLIRQKENADFTAADKELSDTMDTLTRAISVLKKSVAAGAGFLQGAQLPVALAAVAGALGEIVQAESIFSAQDLGSIDAILATRDDENSNGEEDEDDRQAAADDVSLIAEDSAGAGLKKKPTSGGIVDVLRSMKEKAGAAQTKLRTGEINNKGNFDKLALSLNNKIKQNKSDLDQKKKALSSTGEARASAKGDLATTKKALLTSKKQLADTQQTCMARAGAFTKEVKGRKEELEALALAKKKVGGGTKAQSVVNTRRKSKISRRMEKKKKSLAQTWWSSQESDANGADDDDADSFLQVRTQVRARQEYSISSSGLEVVQRMRSLANMQRSHALMQLASRIKAAFKIEQSGLDSADADPFRKIKVMIGDMMAKLKKEAGQEAGQKVFCDREMSISRAALSKKGDAVSNLKTKLDGVAAKSANLKEEVGRISKELMRTTKSMGETQAIRDQEKQEFAVVVKDMTEGVTAVQAALKVLRDYYGKKSSFVQTDADETVGGQAADSFVQTDMETDMGTDMETGMETDMETNTDDGDAVEAGTETDTDDGSAASAGSTTDEGGASGIIGLLEVVESDFIKNLAEAKSEEDVKKEDFAKTMQELKVVQAKKRRDEFHNSAQIKRLGKTASELMSDKKGVHQELSAVREYYNKLKPKCTSAPKSYEERKKRRDSIIQGLKEALATLGASGR